MIGRVTIRRAYIIVKVTISYHNYHKPNPQYRFIFHTDNKITIRLIQIELSPFDNVKEIGVDIPTNRRDHIILKSIGFFL